ncbi:exopolyphosphatase [soil metagenome]
MTALFARKPKAPGTGPLRTAIIDIGSNSIRLVVYQGPARLPATLFNEKVMAGLGSKLAETGRIDAKALARAEMALKRFSALAREMGVTALRTVATAAVRDASNGGELLARAAAIGLHVELLSGEQEARAAGLGVLSAIPGADGIVGDLGGGSLELVRIGGGEVRDYISFPLGVLRLAAIRAKGAGALDRHVHKLLDASGWAGRGQGLPFYLVGGSWRSLARLDMHLTGYPLPVIHGYELSPARVSNLARLLKSEANGKTRTIPNLSVSRGPTLGNAAALLGSLIRYLGSATTIASAHGLREGLLFGTLDPAAQVEDPLIEAAREEGRKLGRFAEHGDLLNDWIAPLFDRDKPERERLRHTACLLADVGWRANPEFRAERGMEIALHGNWVAIDAAGRAVIAQALYTSLCGLTDVPEPLSRLAKPEALKRATAWGLAMRLGQRMSGGLAGPLERSGLSADDGRLMLRLGPNDRALYGEAVERRHKALAGLLGRTAALI